MEYNVTDNTEVTDVNTATIEQQRPEAATGTKQNITRTN